jgi:hypothetical protein
MTGFSTEQHDLWRRVEELWSLMQNRDADGIRSALHPEYVGWDMSTPFPHDRDAAVHSASGSSPALREYELTPLSVQVYESQVGVVHYVYSATVVPQGSAPAHVTGKWSEVYVNRDGVWMLVSVSGSPASTESS